MTIISGVVAGHSLICENSRQHICLDSLHTIKEAVLFFYGTTNKIGNLLSISHSDQLVVL